LQHPPASPGIANDHRCARNPESFIFAQGSFHWLNTSDAIGEHDGILDSLASALAEIGGGRVSRIA